MNRRTSVGEATTQRRDSVVAIAPLYARIDDVARMLGLGRTATYEALRRHNIRLVELWEGGPRRVPLSVVVEKFTTLLQLSTAERHGSEDEQVTRIAPATPRTEKAAADLSPRCERRFGAGSTTD